MAKGIIAQDGIKGLYAGIGAALLRQATYGTARIGLHTNFSEKLKEHNKGQNIPLCTPPPPPPPPDAAPEPH